MLNINDKLLSRVDEKEYWLLSHLAKRINASGGCWPSISTLLKDTGWKDERTVRKYYRSIAEKGVMRVNPRFQDNGKQLSNEYLITSGLIGVYVDLSTMQQGGTSDAGGRGASDVPQSINHSLIVELDSTTPEQEVIKEELPVYEIVGYLNEKTDRKYRPHSKKTKAHISARWREGYRLEDFKKVIDCKVTAWALDEKMNEYLRPETLFGTKFESYLNACLSQPEVNAVHDLIDCELTEEQGNQYLDYHQKMKESYPKLYARVTMLKASDYFNLRPGGARHANLKVHFTTREINQLIVDVHRGIEKGLGFNRSYVNVLTELNSKIREVVC